MKNTISIPLLICLLAISLSTKLFADDPLTTGKTAFQKGDFLGAIASFKDALHQDKKNPQAYLWLGTSYLKADSLIQAEATLIRGLEYDSQNPRMYELLGDVYVKQKINAAAIIQYNKAVELDNKNASLYLKLGETNREARQYKDAAKAYTNVLLLDSVNVIALRELATIYMRAKQLQLALPLFRDLVKLQPDSISYQINFVKIMYDQKYFKDLIPYAENILKKDSTQIEIRNILRDAYYEKPDYEKALKLFLTSNQDSLSAENLMKEGKTLRSLGQKDSAIVAYEKAYKKDSTLSGIFYDLATLYNEKERYSDAVAMFEKKIATDTTVGYRWASYLQAAQSLAKTKDYKKAKEYIVKSLEYKPDYINAVYLLAQYNGQLGLTTEQSTAYKRVIDLIAKADTNGNGGASKYRNILDESYRTMGYIQYNENKYQESIDYYKKAFQLSPKDCVLALTIGQIYHRLKNEEEAKQYYCKVLQLCPKSEQAKTATTGLKMMGMDCGK